MTRSPIEIVEQIPAFRLMYARRIVESYVDSVVSGNEAPVIDDENIRTLIADLIDALGLVPPQTNATQVACSKCGVLYDSPFNDLAPGPFVCYHCLPLPERNTHRPNLEAPPA